MLSDKAGQEDAFCASSVRLGQRPAAVVVYVAASVGGTRAELTQPEAKSRVGL